MFATKMWDLARMCKGGPICHSPDLNFAITGSIFILVLRYAYDLGLKPSFSYFLSAFPLSVIVLHISYDNTYLKKNMIK